MVRLNSIKYSVPLYNAAVKYLTEGENTLQGSVMQRHRFRRRFDSKHYSVRNGKLYFDERLVIKSPLIRKTLENLQKSAVSRRLGIKSFYSQVAQRYEGISRIDVERYLRKDPKWQIWR